jgi:hypothetical protein
MVPDGPINYFCSLCNGKSEPLAIGIETSNGRAVTPLYALGTGRNVYNIIHSIDKYKQWLERALISGQTIVTNDFKSFLSGFEFKLPKERIELYDVFLPIPKIPNTFEEVSQIINDQLDIIRKQKLRKWQNVAANAAVVYESLEREGVLVGGLLKRPKWSHRTSTGRSKNTGFNLQGTTAADYITDPRGSQSDLLVNFDWRAADVRIAAILSGDETLCQMSVESDPYLKLSEMLDISRNECKKLLLISINQMDVDNAVFDIFPDLRKWMIECKEKLSNGQAVSSILGRMFYNSERPRSAYNATMQGSIAQAMQLTIRRIWESDLRLLAETHDSITISCNKDLLSRTIREVANIMCRPFSGVLDSNPVFPVRINIGEKWCQWKPRFLCSDVNKFQPC